MADCVIVLDVKADAESIVDMNVHAFPHTSSQVPLVAPLE